MFPSRACKSSRLGEYRARTAGRPGSLGECGEAPPARPRGWRPPGCLEAARRGGLQARGSAPLTPSAGSLCPLRPGPRGARGVGAFPPAVEFVELVSR